MTLKPQHWVAIGTFISALALQLGGMQHGWVDATTPTFVAGVLVQAASLITALTAGSVVPRDPNSNQRATDNQAKVG